jgi:putative phage-type endonuclease
MKVVDVIQRSPDWYVWRDGGISASEIAIILNESPYKTPWWLWAEKVGKIVAPNLSRNPIVMEGVRNEPRLRRHIEERYNTILLPICAEFDENPIFRASLDGYSDDDCPWELKWPSDSHWIEVCTLGTESKGYRLYEPQVQQQMLVTGADVGYLVFGHDTPNGIEIRVFEIKRSQQRLDQILQAGISFWNMYQNRKSPEKNPERDFFEPEGLQRDVWIALSEKAREIESELAPLEAQVEHLKQQQAMIKEQTIDMMGSFKYGSCNGMNVTHVFRRGNVDYQRYFESIGGVEESTLDDFRKPGNFSARLTISKNPSNKVLDVDDTPESIKAIANAGVQSDYF